MPTRKTAPARNPDKDEPAAVKTTTVTLTHPNRKRKIEVSEDLAGTYLTQGWVRDK